MPKFNPALVRDVLTDPEVVEGVQFDESGTLLEGATSNPDDLQATFSYVVQLSRLIGESLGAENLREIQITGSDYKAFCALNGDETVAGFGTAKTNLTNLLKKLS